MTGTGPAGKDIVKVMAGTVARYHRGEIDERTAWRETSMLKALMDGMNKSGPEERPLSGAAAREAHRDVFDRILKLIMAPGMEDVQDKFRAALNETTPKKRSRQGDR